MDWETYSARIKEFDVLFHFKRGDVNSGKVVETKANKVRSQAVHVSEMGFLKGKLVCIWNNSGSWKRAESDDTTTIKQVLKTR